MTEARNSNQHRRASSTLGGSRCGSTIKYSDIRSSKVRELVQNGDLDRVIHPKPGVATIHLGAVYGEVPQGRKCSGCEGVFDSLLVCSGCRTVQYCSKECQRMHWRAQHKKDCDRLKAERSGAR